MSMTLSGSNSCTAMACCASFRPQQDVATLRSYLRQRERLIEYGAAHIQHMQKALMQMNVQLHHVSPGCDGG